MTSLPYLRALETVTRRFPMPMLYSSKRFELFQATKTPLMMCPCLCQLIIVWCFLINLTNSAFVADLQGFVLLFECMDVLATFLTFICAEQIRYAVASSSLIVRLFWHFSFCRSPSFSRALSVLIGPGYMLTLGPQSFIFEQFAPSVSK